MESRTSHVAFPVARVVVMMVFLFTCILANANLSFAAPAAKKSPAVTRISAAEHTEARIKELQGVLKITEAQETLWADLTQVMREDAKEMDALTENRAEKTKSMNAVERMKFHSQLTEARLNQMKKFIPPFEQLYASMSDEQKKNADTLFQRGILRKNKRK